MGVSTIALAKKRLHKVLLVPCKDRRRPLLPEEILHVKSDNCYCKITTLSGVVYTLRITLKQMESRLEAVPCATTSLVRVHNEHIISLAQVEFNSRQTVAYFKNGEWLPVGRKYLKRLRAYLDPL